MIESSGFDDFPRVFGDYKSPERERDWKAVVDSLEIGQPISGVVVARAPYGAWLDIGVGFPALLQIVFLRNMNHEIYIADEWCPLGSDVDAKIRNLGERQISLEQVPLRKYIFR